MNYCTCIIIIIDLHHADNLFISEGQFVVVRGYSASIEDIALSALPVRFRFVQLEHRGGFCDCWAVANLTVTLPNGQATELSYVSCLVIIYDNIIMIDHISVRYVVGTPQKPFTHVWRCQIRH